MKTLANKRKNKRLDCLVPVDGQKGGLFDQTRTVDFSNGGLGFVSTCRVPLRKKIAIEIELPGEDQSVLVMGQVKWVRKIPDTENFRIGLSFEDVKWGSKRRLSKYFRKRVVKRNVVRHGNLS